MTKNMVLASLKSRISRRLDSINDSDDKPLGPDSFDFGYMNGYVFAMEQVLSMLEDYE